MLINFENFTCQNLVALEKLLNLGVAVNKLGLQ